ncbi:YaaL family protein [Bacillus piscicola]|uniref:YaaL family protein n=1 Tax=Bacillus piscicola TaxID=1632684 RepID=UPI001F090AF5|nr:YaaL family protein [Bacillus piscicola]
MAMLLKRKKTIRQAENERLVLTIQTVKQDLDRYENMIEKSIDPSDDIVAHLKLMRAKYIFLLKEARQRRINGYLDN